MRIAILGVGWAGNRQIEAIRELDREVAVECLVDHDPAWLAERATALGVAKTYTAVEDALADPAVDAVSICLPHDLHASAAIAAARAGKHILCEKPLAPTVEDATRMIEAAEAHGVRLYVAENVVYQSRSRFLREVVTGGRFVGEPTCAVLTEGFGGRPYGYPDRRAWLAEPEHGGSGTWLLHGVHTVARLRYVFGEVGTVSMREHHTAAFGTPEVEGTMSGLLTLASGLHIVVVQTCETPAMRRLGGWVIHGTRGTIRSTPEGYIVVGVGAEADGESERPYPPDPLSDYAREIEAFADHVAGRTDGPTTGRGERRSVAVVQAGYESARSGRPIDLAARFGPL